MSSLRSSSPGIAAIVALFAFSSLAADKAAGAAGQALYDKECAQCHGATGKGDGEEAAYLTPTPKDFTTLEKRSDEFLIAVIAKGGPAKGLSQAMPAFPKLSQADLTNLVAYIRQLGKGSAKPAAPPR
jgi:mono/diheme cytochrome c family protein